MADRPILFSAPMIRALLDGRKTQTRRVLKPQPTAYPDGPSFSWGKFVGLWPDDWFGYGGEIDGALPYQPGDRLWVRETYFQRGHWEPVKGKLTGQGRQKWAFIPVDDVVAFDPPSDFRKGRHHRDPSTVAWHKRLGRFMPRWASRLTLIVTDVRVECLRNISAQDAIAEGVVWQAPTEADFEWAKDHEEEYGHPVEMEGVWTVPGAKGACKGDVWGCTPEQSYRFLWNAINGAGAWYKNPWVVAVSFDVIRNNIDMIGG